MSAAVSAMRRFRRLDWGVALPALLLVMAGMLLIRSADLGSWHEVERQLQWLGVSIAVAVPLILIPYTKLLRFAPLLWLGGLGFLVLVVTVAPTVNGARRWLIIGGYQFQPSEVAKLATVLMLARWCRRGKPLERVRDWLSVLLIAAIPAALVFQQPDLGTALLFAPMGLAVAYVGGMPRKALVLLVAGAVLVVGLASEFLLEDYQKERIWSTYNLDRMTAAQRAGPGYQLEQSLLAIGNGGILGHGHGEGPRIQSGKLPYQNNDFIFAVACEEHGLVGAGVLVALYATLVIAILRIAHGGRDPAGRVLCVAAATVIGAQALVHMAVTLGLAPTKGLPLPMISAGGTSLLATLSMLALVQNVAIHRPRVPLAGLAPRDDR